MRQHLKVMVAAALFCVGTALGWGQNQAANVARVSFVQGAVQLMAGQGSDFQQAVVNMPVLDGSRLQCGGDGEVEIEFGDGSVARLTPNSSLQFDHLGEDQVQLQQLSGLGYYEFNVGEGHPPFSIQFAGVTVQPATNSILRVGLDAGWDVAVISGAANVQGEGIPGVAVQENQNIHAGADNSAPYVVAQGINGDSWDNWNQDRDQAIAQEAQQQTPVREDSANPQSEGWNDLDADGNWYPVEGQGNVWVPAGIGADWDPYGAGYWAYYPTFGYTWVSSYPWGWLPYHCGAWSYYSFGWGWAPGGCGGIWHPVIVVRSHPPGWTMPLRPPGGLHPQPGQHLVAVDRGPVATGPWAFKNGLRPVVNHQQTLTFNGREVTPVEKAQTAPRGTAPGSRAFLSAPAFQRQSPAASYMGSRPAVGYTPPPSSFNQRSTYVPRSMPSPHYSPPPPPHYSAPAPPHVSAPGPRH